MINVGIVGISGYSGRELLEILLKHKDVRVNYISANNTTGHIKDLWPEFKDKINLKCDKIDTKQAINLCDLVFLAVPHTAAMSIAPELLKAKIPVIDLSADYRLNNSVDYKKWYKTDHLDPLNLKKAVYGLPELYRENIKKSRFISNPGCYPTAALIGLAPIVSTHADLIESIAIDAKSGVSGAGRKAAVNLNYCEVNENFKAYKVLEHQHAPEINLYLKKLGKGIKLVDFVPHLLPINRGILETIYVRLNSKVNLSKVFMVYKRFYKTEEFVRVNELGSQPEIKDVIYRNFCDLGLALSQDKKLLVITSVIDNLVKGAAGQAVQNMNIMFGFKENEGLL